MNKTIKELICAGLALCGYSLVGYGCWLIWHPLAYIFGGVLLCVMAGGASSRAEVPE